MGRGFCVPANHRIVKMMVPRYANANPAGFKDFSGMQASIINTHREDDGPASTMIRLWDLLKGTGSAKTAVFQAHVRFSQPAFLAISAKPPIDHAHLKKRFVRGAPPFETVVSVSSNRCVARKSFAQ
mmetsp:Transcript_30760/g.55826  ORF Transcript_30760/g.55826 Transcript_30760/m.55826 type:complete len:127 (-) Transcript_30760:846-1226(-)